MRKANCPAKWLYPELCSESGKDRDQRVKTQGSNCVQQRQGYGCFPEAEGCGWADLLWVPDPGKKQ